MKPLSPPSMQWRMTLVIAAGFLALIVAFGWMSLSNVRRGFEQAGEAQLALTRRAGQDLDDRLHAALNAMETAGRRVPAELTNDAATARRWLEAREVLASSFFDQGLFVFDRRGALVASASPLADGVAENGFRRWIDVALRLDEPLIGLPCRCGADKGISLPMVAPFHGADGKPAGVVVGVADILRDSLLGSITTTRLGKTGYLFVSSWDGSVLAHPDAGMLLRRDRPAVAADVLESATRGFRGPVETTDAGGERVLATFVKMQATGWVLGASYPTREAYAQLHQQQRDIILFMVLGTLAVAVATWLLMRAYLTPMRRLADRIAAINVTGGVSLEPVPVPRQSSEAASIGRSFNQLVSRLNEEREQTHVAASVFRNVREGIMVTDPNARIVSCNQAFEDITGYGAEEVRGRTPALLKSGKHDHEFYRQMWQSLDASGSWRGEVWNRRKNGELYPVMLNISAAREDDGSVAYYVGIISDISELKSHQHRLETMATTDALTGLPNRALLSDRLKQDVAHAKRIGYPLAVAFLDLDGFKDVNDREGHHVGDLLLIEVAERFRDAMRLGDTAARLGGDEFVLLLNNVGGRDEALGALQRILDTLREPFAVEGRQLAVSASIGVTFYPDDDVDPDTLLRHADHAMYQAKNLGRARIHVFDPTFDKLFQSHQVWVEEVRRGIRNGELVLHYQPKVDLLTHAVIGVEALLRWNHPERGFLQPGQFIEEVATDDVVIEIGEWVIAEACRQIAAWHRESGIKMPVSINLAARHLADDRFVDAVRNALQSTPGLDADALEIEILESDTLQDPARLERVIRECQAMGVKFSLDDFGTGYSSLSHLKNIPADVLKIDRSFVMNMLSSADDLAIVEGIVRLAYVFKREVIAEGVETPQHIDILCNMGCYRGQGYGIARPMPAAQVASWVESYTRH